MPKHNALGFLFAREAQRHLHGDFIGRNSESRNDGSGSTRLAGRQCDAIGFQRKITKVGFEIEDLDLQRSALFGVVREGQAKRHRRHRTAEHTAPTPRRVTTFGVTGRSATHATHITSPAAHPAAMASTTTSADLPRDPGQVILHRLTALLDPGRCLG